MKENTKKMAKDTGIFAALTFFPTVLVFSFGPVTGLGPWEAAGSEVFILLVPVILLFTALAATVLLFIKSRRQQGWQTLAVVVISAILYVPLMTASTLAAYKMRSWGFHLVANRAEPLVAAIDQYRERTVNYPGSLEELFPDYLDAMPYGLPPLEITHFNGWGLKAKVSIGLMNWDEFIYKPDQNYPVEPSYERIGKWVYYHE